MGTITVDANGGMAFDGRDAVEVFKLVTLRSALRLQVQGLRMSRHFTATQVFARDYNGGKRISAPKALALIDEMIEDANRVRLANQAAEEIASGRIHFMTDPNAAN